MLCELLQVVFPKNKLVLYRDEMIDTVRYHDVTERTKAWWDREDVDAKCSVGKPRPSLYIDYFADGPMTLNVEIGHRRKR